MSQTTSSEPSETFKIMTQHPTPEQLANGLLDSIPAEKLAGLDQGQKIFLKNWLFAVGSYASELSEEKRRLDGQIQIRTEPKASSFFVTGEAEQKFYTDLLAGKVSAQQAQHLFMPQDIVYTTHPNFSQNRVLADLTPKLVAAFLDVSPKDFSKMAGSGEDAKKVFQRVTEETGLNDMLAEALTQLKPRKARSRADELDEATCDLMPRVYSGLTEEVAILLKRAKQVGVREIDKHGESRPHPALTDTKWQMIPLDDGSNKSTMEPVSLNPTPLSYEQVIALSGLTSTHSTWFTDGDGKRTSHAWDNDYAIPAIKAKALEEFKQDLLRVKDNVSHLPVAGKIDALLEKLDQRLERIVTVRDAARDRMDALTKLQTFAENTDDKTREAVGQLQTLRNAAKASGVKYRKLILDKQNVEALTAETSSDVLSLAKELKQLEGKGGAHFSRMASAFDNKTPLSNLDSLIIKASKGDFMMKIERRENANQHKRAMRYLFENLSSSREVMEMLIGHDVPGSVPPHKLTKQDFSSALRATAAGDDDETTKDVRDPAMRGSDEMNLTKVLKVLDHIAASGASPGASEEEKSKFDKVKWVVDAVYERLADYVEPEYEKMPYTMPLETVGEKSEFLDDVSPFFISGKLYPNAYKRIIIAEAGSPSNEVLSSGVDSKIRHEALLRDVNDLLTVNVFKNLLRSPVDGVSLYEDPDAILHTPEMLEARLKDPSFHNAMGIDKRNAESRSLKGDDGKQLTAYEFMRAQGFSDEIMTRSKEEKGFGLKLDELKKAYVYVGPKKMLANSDSAKRGSLAASTLNQISVVESYAVAAKADNLLTDTNGKKFMFINEIYLGQGGALARTTGTDALVNTVTEQGQHPTFTTGAYSAMKSVNRGVTRLGVNMDSQAQDPASSLVRRPRASKEIALETMALGNPYAMKMLVEDLEALKESAVRAIRRRIKSTRDDIKVNPEDMGRPPLNGNANSDDLNTRYEEMLAKYGEEFIPNYSARPASKGSKPNFVGIRAIGLAGQEFGIFSNIMGVAEMMEFSPDGRLANLDLMARMYQHDPSVKHNFDAASYTACLSEKSMPLVWKKGGVEMAVDHQNNVVLRKGGSEVRLSQLVDAYHQDKKKFGKFDAADLALANIHQQTENFVRGMTQIRQSIAMRAPDQTGPYVAGPGQHRVKDPIELIPEHLRNTVRHAQGLVDEMLQYIRATEKKPGVILTDEEGKRSLAKTPEGQSLRMAKDAYYQLMETSLEQQALSRVRYVGRAA